MSAAVMDPTRPRRPVAVEPVDRLDAWLRSTQLVRRLDVQWLQQSYGWICQVTAYEREPHPLLGWRDVPVMCGDGRSQIAATVALAERGVRSEVW